MSVLRESFDGGDLFPGDVERERKTRANRFAIDVHGASPARSAVAHHFCAGEIELIAKGVQERGARLDAGLVGFAVDVERDWHGVRPLHLCAARSLWKRRECAGGHCASTESNALE